MCAGEVSFSPCCCSLFRFHFLVCTRDSEFTFERLSIAIMEPIVSNTRLSFTQQPTPTTTSEWQTLSTTATGTSTHTIQVGGRQDPHQYSPSTIEAIIGDTLLFQFLSNNHSVVQADYMAPCVPSMQKGYFSSDNFHVDLNTDGTVAGTVSLGLMSCLFILWLTPSRHQLGL